MAVVINGFDWQGNLVGQWERAADDFGDIAERLARIRDNNPMIVRLLVEYAL
ncbi:MAG: hypothetical protein JNK76_02225 [Planctomycetales bacterium]|nr:hypothetical protein [Planctomycetales bacterium]MBN8628119.1 hypothetical protein [Planctomycetota bacterium]